MPDFIYPTASELREVGRVKEPVLTQNDPVFTIIPIEEADTPFVTWEQKDNFVGLQQIRGLDGKPGRVLRTGAKKYVMTPGYYGEFTEIDETELTTRRQFGTFGTPVDIGDLVMDAQDQLLQRRIDRIRYIAWNALMGRFVVADGRGLEHSDVFAVKTFTASNLWTDRNNSEPVQDFRSVRHNEEGQSSSFGPGARAFMNLYTWEAMVRNRNANDLGGARVGAGLTAITAEDFESLNAYMRRQQLPTIIIYNETYFDDDGTLKFFIPNGKVIVVANRPSANPGAYKMTRNVNTPGMGPGAYTYVVDTLEDRKELPRRVEVHDGHNGGPTMEFPGDITVMTVY